MTEKKIALVIGQISIVLSNFSPEKSFRKNKSKTPKRSGSVGINIPIPPKSKLSKLKEKGVKKIISNNTDQ